MIEFTDLSYGYTDTPLFADVNITLMPGSFHFLTGPSGAGKTTLMRLCYGELFPSAGNVSVFGQSTHDMDRDQISRLRRRVGMIHQNCQFLDHLSLCDNIALPLKLARQTHNADDMDIAHLMSWVGLTARQDAYPPELSGGERQRAALARALITNPDVIFADEPTGNIDWDMSMTVLDYLVQMHQAGKTILIATHDLGLVRAAKQMTVARVLRINQGSLEIAGTDL